MKIVKCPVCKSEIATDDQTNFPIDCDCGYEITKEEHDQLIDFY